MCQFCRLRINAEAVEYAGKLFHKVCFEEIQNLARRTGGIL